MKMISNFSSDDKFSNSSIIFAMGSEVSGILLAIGVSLLPSSYSGDFIITISSAPGLVFEEKMKEKYV